MKLKYWKYSNDRNSYINLGIILILILLTFINIIWKGVVSVNYVEISQYLLGFLKTFTEYLLLYSALFMIYSYFYKLNSLKPLAITFSGLAFLRIFLQVGTTGFKNLSLLLQARSIEAIPAEIFTKGKIFFVETSLVQATWILVFLVLFLFAIFYKRINTKYLIGIPLILMGINFLEPIFLGILNNLSILSLIIGSAIKFLLYPSFLIGILLILKDKKSGVIVFSIGTFILLAKTIFGLILISVTYHQFSLFTTILVGIYAYIFIMIYAGYFRNKEKINKLKF